MAVDQLSINITEYYKKERIRKFCEFTNSKLLPKSKEILNGWSNRMLWLTKSTVPNVGKL